MQCTRQQLTENTRRIWSPIAARRTSYEYVNDQQSGVEPTRLHPRLRLGRIVDRSNRFQIAAFVFCVLFGLAMIANTEPAVEGVWFWYSFFLDSGKHLYGDMHLVLQPLFVLETNAFMAVLGKGWLVSKIVAALHLVAYCLGLFLLVRQSDFSDARKAILLACSFFVSISLWRSRSPTTVRSPIALCSTLW